MNADGIVRALREMATYDCGYEEESDAAIEAICLIKSLQADHESYQQVKKALQRGGYSDIEAMVSRYKQVMIAAKEEIESLQAQLSESQRRERAAAEDIHTVYSDGLCEVCGKLDTCLMTLDRGEDGTVCHGTRFEWRGPQEAGEGETE